jgi:hypothetical protein
VRRVCLLFAIAACGRVDFERHDVLGDGAVLDVAAPVSCGSNVVLDDPFDDTTDGPLFIAYTSPGMTTSEAGGSVSFVFSPSTGAGRYAGYDSAMLYPSQELCATVEIGEVPVDEGLGYFNIVAGTQKIEFIVYRGSLELRIVESGTPTGIGLFPFDPVAYKFWRLRQHAGVTYWDVSADNITFANLAMTTFFTQAMSKVAVGAGAVMTTTNGGKLTVQQMQITAP